VLHPQPKRDAIPRPLGHIDSGLHLVVRFPDARTSSVVGCAGSCVHIHCASKSSLVANVNATAASSNTRRSSASSERSRSCARLSRCRSRSAASCCSTRSLSARECLRLSPVGRVPRDHRNGDRHYTSDLGRRFASLVRLRGLVDAAQYKYECTASNDEAAQAVVAASSVPIRRAHCTGIYTDATECLQQQSLVA
jgi:hypothetical protein